MQIPGLKIETWAPGKGCRYAHDEEGHVADMDCLPASLQGRSYYQPTQEGREKQLAQRMAEVRKISAGKQNHP